MSTRTCSGCLRAIVEPDPTFCPHCAVAFGGRFTVVSSATDQELDCGPPGLTREQKIDVLERLHSIHRRMHAGKPYSFEQTLLCDTVREIEQLRRKHCHQE